MKAVTLANKYFAIAVWNRLPAWLQKDFSTVWSKIYKSKLSTFFIPIFCSRYEMKLELYEPASGQLNYSSFQDFFTRKLKVPIRVSPEKHISPCQGFVCESGRVSDFNSVHVKGKNYFIRDIFDDSGKDIEDNYSFINIFLHNHNYHRLHSPVSGTIRRIKNVPGQLNFLRPWFYDRKSVSSPSFVNERYIIEIEDLQKRIWFLSFVGGMGVGTIRLANDLKIGSRVFCGEELGHFLLGSTCCLAIPVEIKEFNYLQKIDVGELL